MVVSESAILIFLSPANAHEVGRQRFLFVALHMPGVDISIQQTRFLEQKAGMERWLIHHSDVPRLPIGWDCPSDILAHCICKQGEQQHKANYGSDDNDSVQAGHDR